MNIEHFKSYEHICRCCGKSNPQYILKDEDISIIIICESCLDELQRLEKPKKKIKKWLYVTRCFIDNSFQITANYYKSINEAKCYLRDGCDILSVIPESEIEVEE